MSENNPAEHHVHVDLTEDPPHKISGILRRLGPGLIIAGSIVGSGELIATTKTGAEAGFALLWLILIGCVIKVFAQVEFGRYTLVTNNTAMDGMNETPIRIGTGSFLVWFWLAMFIIGLGQLGGIVGGVGQAMAISIPLTEQGRAYNEMARRRTQLQVVTAQLDTARAQQGQEGADSDQRIAEMEATQSRLQGELASLMGELANRSDVIVETNEDPDTKESVREVAIPPDDRIWAVIIAVITAVILVLGHYGLIQTFATAMVASFTVITVANVFALQSHPDWAVQPSEFLDGLKFHLSRELVDGRSPLATALATFGIIGVGASELVAYPYWCLEKGYARFTGHRDDTEAWGHRATGWMRVMRWDCWCSMVVYTFATVAFYMLGAAVLHRSHLTPGGTDMIRTLGVMYTPVFGAWAEWLFLFGAFAVLYSTFFVANAGHARVFSDCMRVLQVPWFRRLQEDPDVRRNAIRILSGVFPLLCAVVYVAIPAPAELVLISGAMQAVMLPMLGAATLFFRYRRCDPRIAPGKAWDVFLWISALGLLLAGGYLVLDKLQLF